jgi:hypothetical protein
VAVYIKLRRRAGAMIGRFVWFKVPGYCYFLVRVTFLFHMIDTEIVVLFRS